MLFFFLIIINGSNGFPQILLIGKSINFIRQCCKDTTWVTDTRALSEDSKGNPIVNLLLQMYNYNNFLL